MALRVGSPPYLVARPLDCGLEREGQIELVRAVPSRLVELLRAGELDVALVSSIELFRRPGYAFLAGPAVSARGPVASVQVFLRRPLAEVETVALDPSSRAAQALTRIVLPRRLGRAPRFLEPPAGSDPAEACPDAHAWLRIGDPALRTWLAPAPPPAFNPSAAWTEDTGLPFVFAVWLVRAGLELTPGEVEAFAAARARGAEHIEALGREASQAWGLPLEACRRYLREECRYDAGPELEPALWAFRDAAAALGLCRADLEPRAVALPAAPCPRG